MQKHFIMKKGNTNTPFKIGDVVKVSPYLTKLNDWIIGTVIDILKNPFLGDEIAIKDKEGRIFFGEQEYFKAVNS